MIGSVFPPTSRFSIGLALVLGLVLLVSAPFVHALEIHHLFAEVDHDGHQHSDFDLCQWVQHHTASSPICNTLHVSPWSVVSEFLLPATEEIGLVLTLPLRHPRGPPGLLFS